MEGIKDTGNEIFNKSSMSVVELNNYVSIISIPAADVIPRCHSL